ncbi:hypothetical protein N7468_009599 [Penicillium chermesinum]|uniref:Endosomal sorting complex protein TSG101 n=1 Tax=Penicillium chermesinum TaxID=63820 RepID=A0A9W9NI39_9EURO|nr:uncharacterized protein N7468_009599 [Penicillium chermesinum]KAJ5220395.1 hypothetical protein N7468_009599 [Penicillium chermesinum]
MALPQRTLSWLYSVLSKDHYDPNQTYHDPNRTYQDVVSALAQYPSLSPRTDVYTYENGFSCLLLHLVGTLPVVFRGTTYRFPIALWIPNTYPKDPPMVYVTPPQDMAVRPGQHVTLEGRVYHHYLAHWAEAWDRSTITDFLSILREVFAKEPPVRYRQQPSQPQPQQTQTPPPLPPLPPGVSPTPAPSQIQPASPLVPAPPQLPPKPGAPQGLQSPQGAERYKSPPPLPPLPPKENESRRISASIPSVGPTNPGNRASRQFVSPQYQHPQPPIHPLPAGAISHNRDASGPQQPYQQPGPQGSPASPPPQVLNNHPIPLAQPSQYMGYQPHPHNHMPPGPAYQQSPYPPNYQPVPPAAPAAPAPKPPAPDLLTSPFELELPSFAPTGPAPPIPPNPEKDALLHAVSKTLSETLQTQASQSDAAAQSLVSQSHSLQSAMATLQAEFNPFIVQMRLLPMRRLGLLFPPLPATSGAPGPSTSSDAPTGLPPIDDVLVAPTVVGKQLYDLVAEEEGLQHALYALQAALVRGVIGVDSWSRQTRGLAREAFLKKALIRKVARGMGLEEPTI